jgi:uncharacterized repeat protein (TIGR01451 family)
MLFALAPPAANATVPIVPDDTWGANDQVTTVLRVGGTIYLGGRFTALQSDADQLVTRNHLAAIDAATGQPTSFDPNVDGEVFDLAESPDGTRLFAAGNFNTVSGQTHKKIAVFDVATGALLSWKPTAGWPNNVVRAVWVTTDTVYIGGAFTAIGSITRTRVAALNASSGATLSWAPTADGLVRDLAVANARVWLAGNFQNVNGTAQRGLTMVDPSTGASICCSYHTTYPVLDLEAGSSRVYLAGGGGGGKAAAVSISTGAKLWEKKTDGNVQAVGILNGTPYFGGHFFKYTSIAVGQLVRADPATGNLDTTWFPNVTAGFLGVFAVSGFNANLYVGGDFTRVSNTKQLNFAQFTDDAISAAIDVGVSLGDAPDPVDAGSTLTYTASITNAGPDAASGVTLTDALPATVTFVSASPTCTYSPGPHSVTCEQGTIGAGGSSSPTITVSPGTAGQLSNAVSVTAIGTDPNPGNDSASATTTVSTVAGADLNLTMTPGASAKVDQGTAFDYVLTVTNQGPDTEPDATLVDTLPSNVTANGSPSTSQGSCTGTSVVTCDLGQMSASDVATVTIPVLAPSSPQTVVNAASVDGLANDADHNDDAVTRYTPVRDPAQSGDTTAPTKTAMEMSDQNADGYVDRVVVTFSENLAPCVAPCTAGWVLTNVPSAGVLQSVTVGGNQATLTLGAWQNLQDTSVGLFKVQLDTPNQLQDAAGNRPSFAAATPSDKAGPVPVGFRHQHNSTASGCVGSVSTSGLAEVCDEVTVEWSEALAPSSIPSTTTVTLADPSGSGNDSLSVGNFIQGSMNIGSDGYVTIDGASAAWTGSSLILSGAAQDTLTIRIMGACTGTGCGAVGVVSDVTVVYVPSTSIKDAAGNVAAGSFTKFQRMF